MVPELEEFAKVLIKCLRDESIQSNDMNLRPTAKSLVAERWRTASMSADPMDFARAVIPDVVDETIFYLLQAIDEGSLRLTFDASNGRTVDLTTQGESELAGWYMGTAGWREMFSKERFADDFSDLR